MVVIKWQDCLIGIVRGLLFVARRTLLVKNEKPPIGVVTDA